MSNDTFRFWSGLTKMLFKGALTGKILDFIKDYHSFLDPQSVANSLKFSKKFSSFYKDDVLDYILYKVFLEKGGLIVLYFTMPVFPMSILIKCTSRENELDCFFIAKGREWSCYGSNFIKDDNNFREFTEIFDLFLETK